MSDTPLTDLEEFAGAVPADIAARLEAENTGMKKHLREFFRLLDIEEMSDSERPFHPNRITSCRVMDGLKINQALKALKEYAQS